MTERDDFSLLRDFAATESESAFAALVERHVHLVYSVALRSTGNAHAAQEISQAVFIILARKARSLTGGWQRRLVAAVRLRGDGGVASTPLSGWLHQTARLTAANYVRGEIRRQKREQETFMQSTLNETADETWRQIAPVLDDAISRLGAKDRDAIVLRFFENKSLGEVGAALGASEDAAKMRVNRALEKLRKIFTKRGVTFSAAAIAGAVSANSVQAAPVGLAKTISAVAIAKGAAAGGSTLALMKGALKIMAWTKANMAIGVVAGLVLATSVSVVLIHHESLIDGKTESEWIKGIVYNGDDQQRKLWHSLGPRGVKMLLHAMKPPPAGLTQEQAIVNRQTRMCAADLLGTLENTYNDDAGAIPDVIKLLQTEQDDQVRALELAFFELPIQTMSEQDKAALLPELVRSLNSTASDERNNALVQLQYYTDRKGVVVPLIVNAMHDGSPLVRMMAVKALNKIDPQNPASSNSVSVLAGCVTAPPGNTSSAANEAVVALGEFHREPAVAVPALIQALGSDQFWTRANAAAALGRFGGQAKAAIPALQKALEDSDASVRRQAVAALQRINSDAPAR